jgi:YD repeat-containing protein
MMRRTGIIWLALFSFCLKQVPAETYSYDDSGRLIKVVYPAGQRIEYSYDSAGSMTSKGFFTPGELPGEGWHLISPGTIDDLGELLSSHAGIESVAGWDGTTYAIKYRTPPSINPHPILTSTQAGLGYWIQSSTGSVSVTGVQDFLPQDLASYNLGDLSGWRLMGTPSKISDLNTFFNTLPSVGVIWSYDSVSKEWMAFKRGDEVNKNQLNEQFEMNFKSLREIEAGTGFWIFLGL